MFVGIGTVYVSEMVLRRLVMHFYYLLSESTSARSSFGSLARRQCLKLTDTISFSNVQEASNAFEITESKVCASLN